MRQLLQKETDSTELNENLLPQPCIKLPASAYISAHTVSSVQEIRSHEKNRTTAVVMKAVLRTLQKVAAKGNSFKSRRARFDQLMVEAGHTEDGKTEMSVAGFRKVLFSKMFLFIGVLFIYLGVQCSLDSLSFNDTNNDAKHENEL